MPESRFIQTVYRWRVRVCSLALILIIILSKPTPISMLTGIAICLAGLLLRTWASGYLKKDKELTISGPYQYTRNPLYLGNLILGTSVVVGSWSLWVFLIFVAYFLLFYPLIMRREQERMKKLFPQPYEEYSKKVPLFFPNWRPYPSQKYKFSWPLFKKNKEYRALAGAAAFWLIMALKMILFR